MDLHKLPLDKLSPSPCEIGTDYAVGVENARKTRTRVRTKSKYLLHFTVFTAPGDIFCKAMLELQPVQVE